MFKILGVVLMCVQLIIGSPETEELKRKCLNDEEFPADVKLCSIKDGIASFEFIERTLTFRCISIQLQNTSDTAKNLTIKVTSKYDLTYKGAVLLLKGTEDEINLKLYTNFTARIAIVSYKLGFRITDVQLDNATLSHDWNCKNPFYLKELCGIKPKESKLVKNKSWPWVVAIYQYRLVETKSKYKAGGSILSTKYILTSGNGLFYEGRFLLSEELKVHVSRTDLNPRENSQAFKIYKVNKVLHHEQYKFALENNIALLQVENYIEFNDFVQPICLPSIYRDVGEIGHAVGFEKDEWNPHPLVSKATDSSYTLLKRDVCEKNQFLQHFKHVQTFCALANMKVDESANVVKIEDLGSGLYINERDVWFIGGLISKVSTTDQIVVFTDVFQYLDWINSHTTIFVKSSD